MGMVYSLAAQDNARDRTAVPEESVRANPGRFDWAVHNQLRHLHISLDDKKSLLH